MSDHPRPPDATTADSVNTDGRCPLCGYSLRGLPPMGRCPECGEDYDPRSSFQIEPRPSAATICMRVGWPLIGLSIVVATVFGIPDPLDPLLGLLMILGYFLLLAAPINAYFQVRSMLKRHMPERDRTTGVVALLRGLGTVVCVVAFILFMVPLLLLGACLLSIGSGY